MIGRNSETVTTRWDHDDDPNQDTLTLLQDEIARLEAELRARDDAPPPLDHAGDRDEPGAWQERVDGLLAELAVRDETVEILLEQSRLYEEAAAAQRAEWEQLHQWVDEVERRVDGRDADGPRLRAELEAERGRAESSRVSAESDRRGWEAHRVGLERENQLLRGEISRQQHGAEARDETAFLELAAENRRLRTEVEALRVSAADSEVLGGRLAATAVDLENALRELRRLEDERERERIEHEAETVALRSELAREPLRRQVDSVDAPAPAEPERPTATDADERIRAFRLHLKELHENEESRRADRSLASRLSRLWRHTGPG